MKKTVQLLMLCFIISSSALAQKAVDVKINELDLKGFKQKVWNFDKDKSFNRIGNLPIILDFHATWCRPCKMLAPHLQAIQNKYNGKLVVYKIDVDQQPELAKLFKIEAMPTIIFIGSKTSYKSELGYKDYDEFEKIVKANFFKK
ncbi:MAG: thioredoxin fold domain-containing protein [Paludibacter sp.]|nr:thioredoxin fold domain-containing protein [Paludibacter sp.]